MRVNGKDLTMVSGDNEDIDCFSEEYTMTENDKIKFVLRTVDDVTSTPVLVKLATIQDGHGVIKFVPNDTKNLLGTYYYDINVVFANGVVKTPIRNHKFVII